jgi:hypothetical protein
MATSIVNGYTCFSSCDVAKAKKGEDPHPNLHAGDPSDEKQDGKVGSGLDGPAVLFGGALSGQSGAQAVTGVDATAQADPASLWKKKFSVDVLA